MRYRLVTGHATEAFERSVQRWLDLGYEPLGGVAFQKDGSFMTYAQALVKHDPDTTEA